MGLQENSSDCMTFDLLPTAIKDLLKDCVLSKKDVVDQGFLLIEDGDKEWEFV